MVKNKYTFKVWDKYLFISVIVIFTLQFSIIDIDNLSFTFQKFNANNNSDVDLYFQAQSKSKYRIGIVHPRSYAASQEAIDNCVGAKNIGWDCYIFGYSLDTKENKLLYYYASLLNRLINYFYKPDFVIYLEPVLVLQDGKPIRYGVIDIMNADILKYREEGALEDVYSLEWMTSYDGFIIYGSKHKWFNEMEKLISDYYKISKQYVYNAYPSVYSTEFVKARKKKLVFYGNIWDAKRSSENYKQIYRLLDEKDYFSVYGDSKVWSFLHNSYQGKIPFNDYDFITKLQELGIALVLHSNIHLKYGIPSKRIFEASAASNVIISDYHSFVEKEFGDCAYFIDFEEEPQKVVARIDKIVKLVQADQILANEKASCAHNIFREKYSIESQLLRISQMHGAVKNILESKLIENL